ncbi:MAG: trypsin-like peptidase domain-containing protein [bacterium]|nr:trypsin-like peptidase domain-containing protein [bacterium]
MNTVNIANTMFSTRKKREKSKMTHQPASQLENLVKKLDDELIARTTRMPGKSPFEFQDAEGTHGRQAVIAQVKKLYETPPEANKALKHIDTQQLVRLLILKAAQLNKNRGIWGTDSREDYYEIRDEQIKKNARCTAAIVKANSLEHMKNGTSTLRVKNYGKAFNLCNSEPFRHQPVAAGQMCSGILVKDDIIATAGHCAYERNVTNLRILFGYKMAGPSTPVTQVPNENIYRGVELIRRTYERDSGSDWALIRLDRKVEGQEVAVLSNREIAGEKPVYITGYPVGLPLKYSPGASVCAISKAYFSADLNVYCSSSGSPVFDSENHDVIGIVARGDNRDFRWTGRGWKSIVYPNQDLRSKEPECTRVSEFRKYCR